MDEPLSVVFASLDNEAIDRVIDVVWNVAVEFLRVSKRPEPTAEEETQSKAFAQMVCHSLVCAPRMRRKIDRMIMAAIDDSRPASAAEVTP